MSSTRLHIDAAAPVVAAQAAASASAALMNSAAAVRSAGAAPTNPFDVLAQAVRAWATTAHHSASTAAQARSATVGALSAQGFTVLNEMNALNSTDLRAVGQEL